MPVLHLQIDVDSDVQPELHAVLAAIAASPARSERLRQLAAAGLIWEHLRQQSAAGPGLRELGGPEMSAPSAQWRNGATFPAGVEAAPAVRARGPSVEGGQPTAGEPAGSLGPAPSDVRLATRPALPVLQDVVETLQPSRSMPGRRDGARRAPAAPEPALVKSAAEPPVAGEPGAPARKTGARTRLVRMQEKGLFKNG